MQQDTLFTVNISDFAFTTRRGSEARVVGKLVCRAVKFAYIDDIWPQGAGYDWELSVPFRAAEGNGFFRHEIAPVFCNWLPRRTQGENVFISALQAEAIITEPYALA